MQESFPPEECPECGSTSVVYSKTREEIICNECGCMYPRLAGNVMAEKPGKKKEEIKWK